MAPSVVGESLKGAELVAEVMQNKLGMPCNPPPGSHRTDIIQAVQCGTRKKVVLILFLISTMLHLHLQELYGTYEHN